MQWRSRRTGCGIAYGETLSRCCLHSGLLAVDTECDFKGRRLLTACCFRFVLRAVARRAAKEGDFGDRCAKRLVGSVWASFGHARQNRRNLVLLPDHCLQRRQDAEFHHYDLLENDGLRAVSVHLSRRFAQRNIGAISPRGREVERLADQICGGCRGMLRGAPHAKLPPDRPHPGFSWRRC